MKAHPCFCGHSKRNHIQGEALCLVRSCRLCLVYRPSAPLYWTDTNGNARVSHIKNGRRVSEVIN